MHSYAAAAQIYLTHKKVHLLTSMFAFLVALLMLPDQSFGGKLEVCNEGTAELRAVRILEDASGFFVSDYIIEGWYIISPGKCRSIASYTLISGPEDYRTLDNARIRVGFIAWNAKAESFVTLIDPSSGAANYEYCVDELNAFELRRSGLENLRSNCPEGWVLMPIPFTRDIWNNYQGSTINIGVPDTIQGMTLFGKHTDDIIREKEANTASNDTLPAVPSEAENLIDISGEILFANIAVAIAMGLAIRRYRILLPSLMLASGLAVFIAYGGNPLAHTYSGFSVFSYKSLFIAYLIEYGALGSVAYGTKLLFQIWKRRRNAQKDIPLDT
ncbi:MAG: hypothetical protein HQ501_09945 [Rhodospirillales bacterium]|nr:hypothetical protein [Rhodospirillales bacterium]